MNKQMILQDLTLVGPLIGMFVMSIIPLMIKVIRGNKEPNAFATLMYGFMGLLIAAGLTFALSGVKKTGFSGAIVVDGPTVWMSYLVYIVTGFSLMMSYDHIATRGKQFAEYVFLLMSSAIGMLILMMANDLIVTFIGIETMSLCLYILCAMSKEDILSKEASFKYFILGSFASAIFLLGVSYIYGTVGSTSIPMVMDNIGTLISTNRLFLIGITLVILGFAFKVSIFPFHAWTPDVYQGAPTPVTAFMSTAVKAATFVAFLRFFNSSGYELSPSLNTALQWLAVLTMFVGNVAAVMQDNVKRMLAYSSVAHSGYAMVGLIAAGFGTRFDAGATALLFYLFSYAIMTLGTFAVVALYERYEHTQLRVQDLRGLGAKFPMLAISMTVLMLSLAGLPPFVGFFSKLYIFSAAMEQDYYWLVFWGVINSVISVYYYLRPIVMMYMSDEPGAEIAASHIMTRATVVLSAIAVIAMGLASAPVLRAAQRAVINLF